MPLAVAFVAVLLIAAALALVAALHGHEGAELEASMRWYGSQEGDAINRTRARQGDGPLAA